MSVLTRFLPAPPPPPPILVLAGTSFFVRPVTILSGEALGPQVRLALEGMSPFPPEQLYFGAIPGSDGTTALVFGAYRRRFEAAEVEAWSEAAVVTPEFVPLCAAPATSSSGFIRMHLGPERLTSLAWQPGATSPSLVLTRAGTPADAPSFLDDVRSRTGLSAEVEVQTLEGELSGRVGAGGETLFACGDVQLPSIPLAWFAEADVRDPDFLANRRGGAVRDLWLWRTLLATAALLALAALLELSAGALRWQSTRREALVKAQSEDVKQIDTAQALANRIGELSEKRLMPLEMLAAINPARPDSVVFQRTITRGLHGLEIEAQAGNAEDVGTYSSALRALPVLAEVKTREVRARDGVTSFVLALQFKPEAFRNGGGL